MIRKPCLILAVVLFAFMGVAFAASHSLAGTTWRLNTAKSNSGGMPNPKSLIVHIGESSSTAIAWRAREVTDQGVVKHLSFSGAPGQMDAVKGGDGEQWSSTANDNGRFTVKESYPDGSLLTLNYQTSSDGQTMTGTGTLTAKDGSSHPVTWVWERVRLK